MKPSFPMPMAISTSADEDREHPGERDRSAHITAGEQRHDRGEDQRRDRRVRTQNEHARRTEQRVADEAGDRGVQAGHRRQPGELGVGHALGNEDGGEDEPRDEVGPEPFPPVGRQHPHDGYGLHRSIVSGRPGALHGASPSHSERPPRDRVERIVQVPGATAPGTADYFFLPFLPFFFLSFFFFFATSCPFARDAVEVIRGDGPRSTSLWRPNVPPDRRRGSGPTTRRLRRGSAPCGFGTPRRR